DLGDGGRSAAEHGRRQPSNDIYLVRARHRMDQFVRQHLAENIVLGRRQARREWYHSDRSQEPSCLQQRTSIAWPWWPNTVGAHGTVDVLKIAVTEIHDIGVEDRSQLIAGIGSNDDLAGSGQSGHQSRGQIHAVTVDVDIADDDVTDLDAHAQKHLLALGHALVALAAER